MRTLYVLDRPVVYGPLLTGLRRCVPHLRDAARVGCARVDKIYDAYNNKLMNITVSLGEVSVHVTGSTQAAWCLQRQHLHIMSRDRQGSTA